MQNSPLFDRLGVIHLVTEYGFCTLATGFRLLSVWHSAVVDACARAGRWGTAGR